MNNAQLKMYSVMFLLVFQLAFLFTLVASAEEIGADVGVSTLSIEITTRPGEEGVQSFYVINAGESDEEIEISLSDWDYNKEGVNRFMHPGSLKNSMANWVQVMPTTFVVKAKEKCRVDLKYSIPADAVGPHWMMVLVNTKSVYTGSMPDQGGQRADFYASKTFGIKVRQIDKTDFFPDGRIVDVSIEQTSEKLMIKTIFENTGTTFLEPSGKIQIFNDSGQIVAELNIKDFKTLPGYQREVITEYHHRLSAGNYAGIIILDYHGDQLVGAQIEFEIP